MIKYHRCPGCSTIFTLDDISSEIVTENDAPETRNTIEVFEERLRRVKALVKPGHYIDFGAGTKEFATFLHTSEGVNIICIDTSTKLQIRDIPDESCIGAYMVEVIEHLMQPIDVITQLLTKIKSGGFIYIESTFAEDIHDLHKHPYVDPKIGHRTIISKAALNGQFTTTWFNRNSLIIRKI